MYKTLQGSWRTAGALWIAMEFCGGGSVSDLVHAAAAAAADDEDDAMPEEAIAYICGQTLAGLRYLHSIGKARTLGSVLLANACIHAHRPYWCTEPMIAPAVHQQPHALCQSSCKVHKRDQSATTT